MHFQSVSRLYFN